ncbi:MAG: hypothetical protein JKX94_03115 [Sneathiella sp.]|nr:hypothetical protein [Sneathiella sp.]
MSKLTKMARGAAAAAVLIVSFQASTTALAADQLSAATSEKFMRTWLSMIDTNAPPVEYLKFLPDGDFEQWSYPNAEIKNVEHLKAYFKKTWGMIKQNKNTITDLDVKAEENGRYKITTNVNWTAITAAGDKLSSPLMYTVTIGSGTSQMDPNGEHPKVFRYQIKRK